MNKTVCKKCINNIYPDRNNGGWSKTDEDAWEKQGRITCPDIYYRSQIHSIRKPLHRGCPYNLEHVVLNNEQVDM